MLLEDRLLPITPQGGLEGSILAAWAGIDAEGKPGVVGGKAAEEDVRVRGVSKPRVSTRLPMRLRMELGV